MSLRSNIKSVCGTRLVQYGERERPELPNSQQYRGPRSARPTYSLYCAVHAVTNRSQSKTIKLVVGLTALIFILSGSTNGRTRAIQDLPEGKGVEIARDKCVSCHEADLIVSQRLSRPGWVREVEKMIRWGAVVSDAEKEALVDYFASHFGQLRTNQTATASDESRGKEIFESKCLLCHEADLSQQQRLSRPGWTREVEKMVRWGATITDAEKESLVDYLFKNFGPRPLASGK